MNSLLHDKEHEEVKPPAEGRESWPELRGAAAAPGAGVAESSEQRSRFVVPGTPSLLAGGLVTGALVILVLGILSNASSSPVKGWFGPNVIRQVEVFSGAAAGEDAQRRVVDAVAAEQARLERAREARARRGEARKQRRAAEKRRKALKAKRDNRDDDGPTVPIGGGDGDGISGGVTAGGDGVSGGADVSGGGVSAGADVSVGTGGASVGANVGGTGAKVTSGSSGTSIGASVGGTSVGVNL